MGIGRSRHNVYGASIKTAVKSINSQLDTIGVAPLTE
jgi:hypothetical protein